MRHAVGRGGRWNRRSSLRPGPPGVRDGARVTAGHRRGGRRVVRRQVGRRSLGWHGRRGGTPALAGRQHRAAVLGDQAVRRSSARCGWSIADRSIWMRRSRTTGPSSSRPRPYATFCRIRPESWRSTIRRPPRSSTTGTDVRAACGAATAVASRGGARRVGAVLRPSRRRARATRRRSEPGRLPQGRGVRAAGARLLRRAPPGRARARGRADRARRGVRAPLACWAGRRCTGVRWTTRRGRGIPTSSTASRWRTAEIPAINGHGTARGVAGLYAALLGGRILSPDLLREATTAQCEGTDAVFGHDNAWGLGFAIDGEDFGMGGLGGSYGGASPPAATRSASSPERWATDDRAVELENALRDCLGLPALD